MSNVLLSKINNILNIDKDQSYIYDLDNDIKIDLREYVDQTKFLDIEKVFNETDSSEKLKIMMNFCADYKEILKEIEQLSTYQDFLDYLQDKNITYEFKSQVLLQLQSAKPKKKTKKKVEEEPIVLDQTITKALDQEFNFKKREILKEIKEILLAKTNKFKELAEGAMSDFIAKGTWTLQVGYNYLIGKIGSSMICAPLFFKDLNISVEENVVELELSGQLRINEKLLIFLQKELKLVHDEEVNLNKIHNFATFVEIFEPLFKYKIEKIDINEVSEEDFTKIEEFQVLRVMNFCFISLFDSKTGKIKEDFIELIEKQVDNFDQKMTNDNEHYQNQEFDSQELPLIQLNNPLNVYQKYALRSSINENTLIYGPPGTGKSEIITSIIANLLIQEKSILVVSEKDAALDVIQKRLKKLSSFCFYLKDIVNEDKIYQSIEQISNLMGSFYNENYKNNLFNLRDYFYSNERVLDYNKEIIEFRKVLENYIQFNLQKDKLGNDYKDYLVSINQVKKFALENDNYISPFYEEYKDRYVKLQSPIEFISKVAEYNWFRQEFNISDEEVKIFDQQRNTLLTFLVENDLNVEKLSDFNSINENVKQLEQFIEYWMLNKDRIFTSNLEKNPAVLFNNFQYCSSIENIVGNYKNSKQIKDFLFKNMVRHEKYLAKYIKVSDANKLLLTQRYFQKNEIAPKKPLLFFTPMKKEVLESINETIRIASKIILFQENIYLKQMLKYQEQIFSPLTVYFYLNKHLLKKPFIDFYNKKIEIFDQRILNQYYKYHVNKIERELINIVSFNFDIASKNLKIIETNIPYLIKKYLRNNQDFIYNMDQAIFDILIKSIKTKLANLDENMQTKMEKMFRICRLEAKPHINEFINEYLDCLRIIFPIWLSKPELVAHFTNLEQNMYEVGIFDEASQMFLEKAYPILFRCKNYIIAGDDKQLKPERLIFNKLEFDPKYKPQLEQINFDLSESLLDRAKVAYWNTYTLKNHYRSLSKELIEFSNNKFYDLNLEYSTINNNPTPLPLEVVECPKGKADGFNINKEEATKLISRLKTELNNPTFRKILIICFTPEQKEYILNKLVNEKSSMTISERIKRKTLVIGDLSSVQGDEGDLVLISNVFSKTSPNYQKLSEPRGSNYLNVAITRSKVKMIIFKSLVSKEMIVDPYNIDLTSYVQWVAYLEQSSKIKNSNNLVLGEQAITNFKQEIYQAIMDDARFKSLKVIQNLVLGTINGDLAFYQKNTYDINLIIRLDDWKKNLSLQEWFEDIDREEYLMSRKYKVLRIFEVDWLKNQEYVLNSIVKNLETSLVEIKKPRKAKNEK